MTSISAKWCVLNSASSVSSFVARRWARSWVVGSFDFGFELLQAGAESSD